jgi:hypothetical protein
LSSLFIVVAQAFSSGDGSPIPNLPDPPALVHYTVENPWPVVGLCAVVAVLLVWLMMTGRLQGKRWSRPAALGALVVALAVGVGARLVRTDREALIEQTGKLIDVATAADMTGLRGVLAPEVTLRFMEGEIRYSRDQILDLVEKYPGKTPIDWHKIDRSQAVMDGRDLGRTQVHLRARSKEGTLYDVPVGSWWRIDWRRDGDQWKVAGIQCLQIDNVGRGEVRP